MKIAAIQHDVIWENPSANHEHLTPMVAQAAEDGAELVVLSEMYSTGFSMASKKIAEESEGESESFLSEQAKLKALRESHINMTKFFHLLSPVNMKIIELVVNL